MEMINDFLVPLGYRFCPTDEELIVHFLLRKVRGEPLPCDGVLRDCDSYGENKEPWRIFNDSSKERFYVFTKLKKKSKSRIERTAGCGTWKEQNTNNVMNEEKKIIGLKKLFSYQVARHSSYSSRNTDKAVQGRWLMHEFSLFNVESHGYVLCEIRNEKPRIPDQELPENMELQKLLLQEFCSSSRDDQQVENINSLVIIPTSDGDEAQKLKKRNLEDQEASQQSKRMRFTNNIMAPTATPSGSFGVTFPTFESTSSVISQYPQVYSDVELIASKGHQDCVGGAESGIMKMNCDGPPSDIVIKDIGYSPNTVLCKENREEITKLDQKEAELDIDNEDDFQEWLKLLEPDHREQHDIRLPNTAFCKENPQQISKHEKEAGLEKEMEDDNQEWLSLLGLDSEHQGISSPNTALLCKENKEEIRKPEKDAGSADTENEGDHQESLSLLELDSEHQDIGSPNTALLCQENEEEIRKPEKDAGSADTENEDAYQEWLSLLELDREHQDVGPPNTAL